MEKPQLLERTCFSLCNVLTLAMMQLCESLSVDGSVFQLRCAPHEQNFSWWRLVAVLAQDWSGGHAVGNEKGCGPVRQVHTGN